MPGIASIAQSLSGRVLNTAVEGILLTVVLWGLLRVLGERSRVRFVIWFVALWAIAALPFVAGLRLGTSHASPLSRVSVTFPAAFALFLFIGWLTGFALALLKLGLGLWRVRQLRRNCTEMDASSLDAQVARHLRGTGGLRRVSLCTSDEVTVPTAIGFFHPAVVFPASLAAQLSNDEMEVILLHELAHLRRWDDWTNLAQKLVKAVFFFHPAVWWIERRLALEREMACDEMVIAQTGTPRQYASLLISFTEKLQSTRGLALVHGLVNRVYQLSFRIKEILALHQLPRKPLRKSMLALSAGTFAAIFALTAHAPQWARFANPVAPGEASVVQQEPLRTVMKGESELPRVIPTVFHPEAAAKALPVRSSSAALKTKPPVKKVRLPRIAKAIPQRPFPAQRMFVVLQQAEYDLNGSAVWSICVWQVRVGDDGAAEFESAIVTRI